MTCLPSFSRSMVRRHRHKHNNTNHPSQLNSSTRSTPHTSKQQPICLSLTARTDFCFRRRLVYRRRWQRRMDSIWDTDKTICSPFRLSFKVALARSRRVARHTLLNRSRAPPMKPHTSHMKSTMKRTTPYRPQTTWQRSPQQITTALTLTR